MVQSVGRYGPVRYHTRGRPGLRTPGCHGAQTRCSRRCTVVRPRVRRGETGSSATAGSQPGTGLAEDLLATCMLGRVSRILGAGGVSGV